MEHWLSSLLGGATGAAQAWEDRSGQDHTVLSGAHTPAEVLFPVDLVGSG